MIIDARRSFEKGFIGVLDGNGHGGHAHASGVYIYPIIRTWSLDIYRKQQFNNLK